MARPKTATSLLLPLPRSLVSFRDSTRRFLEKEVPSTAVRDAITTGTGWDAGLWARAVALEWPAMLVPDAHGGAGADLLEAAILAEELGRALLPSPFLSAGALAPLALRHAAADAARAELLPRVADGALRATWAHRSADAPLALDADGRATGALRDVVDGETAQLVLASARDAGGAHVLVALAPTGPGVTAARQASIDPTRRLAEVRVDGAAARVVGDAGVAEGLGRARSALATLLAAEAVGGARRCLELTTDWAKLREQFGRPIGSFQAVKHRLADLLVLVETATAGARLAARLADAGSDAHAAAADLAFAAASRTYRRAAGDCMQLHGGMGYTWDHDAHLHLKRAKALDHAFGSAAEAEARLADAIGVGVPAG